MKISLWTIGKTQFPFITEGMHLYAQRLSHYCSFHMADLPDCKHQDNRAYIQKIEGEGILKKCKPGDILVLLDENGRKMDSIQFAGWVEQLASIPGKQLVFVVGGAYGFSDKVRERADYLLSLSPMTFSHQIVRILFLEQLYRAMTILRGEPYHNP